MPRPPAGPPGPGFRRLRAVAPRLDMPRRQRPVVPLRHRALRIQHGGGEPRVSRQFLHRRQVGQEDRQRIFVTGSHRLVRAAADATRAVPRSLRNADQIPRCVWQISCSRAAGRAASSRSARSRRPASSPSAAYIFATASLIRARCTAGAASSPANSAQLMFVAAARRPPRCRMCIRCQGEHRGTPARVVASSADRIGDVAAAAAEPRASSVISRSIGSAPSRSGVVSRGIELLKLASADTTSPARNSRSPARIRRRSRPWSPSRGRVCDRLDGKLGRRRDAPACAASAAASRASETGSGGPLPAARAAKCARRSASAAASASAGTASPGGPAAARPPGRPDQRMGHGEQARVDEYPGQHGNVHPRSRIVQVAAYRHRLGCPRPPRPPRASASPAARLSDRDSRPVRVRATRGTLAAPESRLARISFAQVGCPDAGRPVGPARPVPCLAAGSGSATCPAVRGR